MFLTHGVLGVGTIELRVFHEPSQLPTDQCTSAQLDGIHEALRRGGRQSFHWQQLYQALYQAPAANAPLALHVLRGCGALQPRHARARRARLLRGAYVHSIFYSLTGPSRPSALCFVPPTFFHSIPFPCFPFSLSSPSASRTTRPARGHLSNIHCTYVYIKFTVQRTQLVLVHVIRTSTSACTVCKI